MHQTTVISFFKYKGFKHCWQALARMGRPPIDIHQIDGLTFFKPLGTGSGNGFSIKPDFSTYGFVTVFDTEQQAQNFVNSNEMNQYKSTATNFSIVFMKTIKSHGEWSKQNPFKSTVGMDKAKPLAVITRATIKPKMAFKFWQYVPSVSKSMDSYKALVFSKGIGEFPLLMQATFSLWTSADEMMNYAYQNPKHAEMVKKTRELQWYSEELFARFEPYKVEGNLIPDFL